MGILAFINALIASGAVQSIITLVRHPDNTLSLVQVLNQNDAGFNADLAQGLAWEAELKAKQKPV
jgi:hypothetical protein